MTETTEWVRLERVFDAPIETVWRMWTEPTLFQQWYGPNGAKVPVAEMDVVVGGRRKISISMSTPNGEMTMWFVGEFKEVNAPTLLVYTESMSDADGVVLTAKDGGLPDGHPEVTEVRVALASQGARTMVTLTHIGVPAGSPGEGGWTQALDKLAALAAA